MAPASMHRTPGTAPPRISSPLARIVAHLPDRAPSRWLMASAGALALVPLAAGIYCIAEKADVPVALKARDGQVVCATAPGDGSGEVLHPGDVITAVDGQRVGRLEDVEFLLDSRRVGDSVTVATETPSHSHAVTLRLVRSYGDSYLAIVILLTIVFYGMGVFVFWRGAPGPATSLYFAGSILAAFLLSTTSAFYNTSPRAIGYALRGIFSTSYAFLPVVFLHFTSVFPRTRGTRSVRMVRSLYILAAALGILSSRAFVLAATEASVAMFQHQLFWFTLERALLVVCVPAGLVNLAYSYASAADEPERRRLRWTIWGLYLGVFPFAFLWALPSILMSAPLIPEELMLLCTGIIPVAFGISIVEYQIMDIDLILNRSIVYGVMIAILNVLFAGIVGISAVLATDVGGEILWVVSGISATIAVLIFDPVRRYVQQIVDKRFFRVQYDFRQAERRFVDEIKYSVSIQQLADIIVDRTAEFIPVNRIGFFILDRPRWRLHLVSHRGFDLIGRRGIAFDPSKLKTGLQLPVALDECIEPGVLYESGDREVFTRWGAALAFPMLSKDLKLLGFLVLGRRKSGTRFASEDIDLLNNVAAEAGLEMQRIALQRDLSLKETEAKSLRELNRLKSDFVSYVSHELRTPLASIKVIANLLKPVVRRLGRRPSDYVRIIEGESDRLSRMVNTILNSAKIEQGTREYHLEKSDLREIVRNVLQTMQYQVDSQDFSMTFRPGRGALCIQADSEAAGEAVANLIVNAIKYSAARKQIAVTLFRRNAWAVCRVEDRGIGIPPGSIEHIFERFYRDPSHRDHAGGVGLGLPLVRHIMEAHRGRVEVTSVVGKGSTFSLLFPLLTDARVPARPRDTSLNSGQSTH